MNKITFIFFALILVAIGFGVWGGYLVSGAHVIELSSYKTLEVLNETCTGTETFIPSEDGYIEARLSCNDEGCTLCHYAKVEKREFQCYPFYLISTWCTDHYNMQATLKIQGGVFLFFTAAIFLAGTYLTVSACDAKMRGGYMII